MLSILLSILLLLLKIIGIVLLIILAILLCILLVPIRYSFEGHAPEIKKTTGRADVTWLLHILHFSVQYVHSSIRYRVKIFGFLLMSNDEEDHKRKQNSKKKKSEKKKSTEKKAEKLKSEEQKAESQKPDEESSEEPEDSIKLEEENSEEPEDSIKPEEVKKEYNPRRTPTVSETEKKDKKKDKLSEDQKDKKDQKSDRKKAKDKKDKESKLEKLKGKIAEGREFMDEYQILYLVSLLKKVLFKLLRHILPRKLTGDLKYGFEDPATTGKITGWAAMFYPFYGRTLRLEPDFQEACLQGDLEGKGRIRIGYIVWILILLLLKKEVRKMIRYLLK